MANSLANDQPMHGMRFKARTRLLRQGQQFIARNSLVRLDWYIMISLLLIQSSISQRLMFHQLTLDMPLSVKMGGTKAITLQISTSVFLLRPTLIRQQEHSFKTLFYRFLIGVTLPSFLQILRLTLEPAQHLILRVCELERLLRGIHGTFVLRFITIMLDLGRK